MPLTNSIPFGKFVNLPYGTGILTSKYRMINV